MRRYLLAAIVSIFTVIPSHSQVFNDALTLKPGHFALGMFPLLVMNGDMNAGVYLTGGVGIVRRIDLCLTGLISEGRSFIGGDIEWGLLRGMPSLSLTTGAVGSSRGATIRTNLNLTFPIRGVASIYMGPELYIHFPNHNMDDVTFPFWIFAGAEIRLSRHLAIPLEADIGLLDDAPHFIGSGLAIYF